MNDRLITPDDERAQREEERVHQAKADAARAVGVRLFASIKPESKYNRQSRPGEKFPVCLQGGQPGGLDYVVSGGPGGRYRLKDVILFAESIDGPLIQISQ